MPGFSKEVAHTLTKEEAVQRLKDFIDHISQLYKDQVSSMKGEWTDNVLDFSLTTYGFTITGNLKVDDSVARLDGQLPFAAMAFRGKIEQSIGDELSKALSGDTPTSE